MLTLVARRAVVQRRLLAAVVVLVAAAASLLGVCTLLLSATQDRAFHVQVQRSQPQDVDVTAYLVNVSGDGVTDARTQAEDVVRGVLGPMRPTVTSVATARMRRLDGNDRLAYLAAGDAIARQAQLTSGRWPTDGAGVRPEAAVPDTAARLLGLKLGDKVTLGQEIGLDGVHTPVTVVVVGTFRPEDPADWAGDPLSGQGFAPAYSDGSVTAPAYGPFVVGDAALLATGSSVTGLRVAAHPTLSLADDANLRAAVDELDHADALLSSRVGDRARITRVASNLPDTLRHLRAQEVSTRATVLVLLFLGTALSLAAVLLAGWLVASVRDEERALLVTFGLSRRQQVGAASVEAVALGLTAAVLAIPIAAVTHARLTHLPSLRAAGLTQAPTVTGALVLTVLAGALVLALALALTALDTSTAPDRGGHRRAVVRGSLAVLLVGVAVAGWWQLRSQPSTTAARGDLTLTAAPLLVLAALTVLAVRVVPPLLGVAARIADRSRGLVVPLAAQQAARRPHVGTAMVLIAASVAAAVFGLSLRATWEQSQEDQAALQVGTDLSLDLPAPAGPEEAAAVAAATDDLSAPAVVSPVIDEPLALGSYLGTPGAPPVLVAVDARHADALLRGRLEKGASWSAVGDDLAPGTSVRGLPLPADGAGVELEGRAPAGAAITVAPTAVVQDPSGFRHSVSAAPVPLDGRTHRLDWLSSIAGGASLVAVRLDLDGNPGLDPGADPGKLVTGDVSVALTVPGAADGAGSWQLMPQTPDSAVRGASVSLEPGDGGAALTTRASLDLGFFIYTGASLLATAFAPPADVPVAVSQDLIDATGAKVGGTISASVGGTAVPLRVVSVVPTVPSAPGRVAVLADADTLSRALIDAGQLDPVVDAWWVGHPAPSTVRALRATGVGDVTTRQEVAAQLAQGPLRVTVPTALLTLVIAAAIMLLAGVGLVLTADRQRRSADAARLRALGLTSGDARRVLRVEHGAFVVPLVLVGTVVGLAAAWVLGPLLIRSEIGAAPVPAAVAAVPWVDEAVLVGGLLVGSLVITAVVTALQVRRSSPADLRAGDV